MKIVARVAIAGALIWNLPLFAAVFTVTSAADSGPGTLRQAIAGANATPGFDSIVFAIGTGPQSIALLSALPAITERMAIDATTQPGFDGEPIVELNGAAAGDANGLLIQAATVTIRGLVINRFTRSGVQIERGDVDVFVNWIGLGLDGTTQLGNGGMGINCISQCSGNIGGGERRERNVISGNGGSGIALSGVSVVSIADNYIGTDAGGLQARPNGAGISVSTSRNVTINRNVIAGNASSGISLHLSSRVSVVENRIGVGAGGATAIPNAGEGVLVDGSNNPGGSSALESNRIEVNTIANNGLQGVAVIGATANVTISANPIFDNGALGIDLNGDGSTASDAGDLDEGPNGLQNRPVLTGAVTSAGNVTVTGTLHSTPSTTYTIELFGNPACAADTEGTVFLGIDAVTTDAEGNAAFSITVPLSEGNPAITATATNVVRGDTSEFSQCVMSVAAPALAFTSSGESVSETAGSVTLTVTRSGDLSSPASVQYATSNGSAIAGQDYSATSGTLTWAAGDATPRTIVVPILDDSLVESAETFTVTLSDPTGATLGTSTATVTIVSDDAAVQEIPTASQWVLLLLAGALALLALRRL